MPDDAGDPFGVQQRELPHDHRAPVVADEHCLLVADVVEQPEHVAGQVDDVVRVDRLGSDRRAVAALVGSQHAVARLGQRRNLVAPRVRRARGSRGPARPPARPAHLPR